MLRSLSLALTTLVLAAAPSAFAQTECPADVGAALAAACPCAADADGVPWKNHGKYVSCVVRYRNELRKNDCIDADQKRTIASCAARSTCGKEGAVLCCVYDASATCSDATPGDATAAGVCSNDDTVACDTSGDCATAKGPKVAKDADRCTAKDGTVVGEGSVCSGCPIPPPAP
jgi:hypothetical protein